MTKKAVVLRIPKGIHLRIAGSLAKKANEFKSDIYIEYKEAVADCKSVMGVAILGLMEGTELTISANGPDESKALLSICSFLENDIESKTDCEIFEKYVVG
ncbi:MAG: HPr family phosphocarrier protein, partial [Spirochaetota bacterium]